jgi:hypothetical protein
MLAQLDSRHLTVARRAAVVLGAAVSALSLWAGAGGHPTVRSGGSVHPVGAVSVLVASVVAGLAGWALLAVLERATSRALLPWTVIAVLVFLLSLVSAATAGVGAGSKGTLLGLHCIVFAVLVAGFWRTVRRARPLPDHR